MIESMTDNSSQKKVNYGRPRLLTHEEVLEGAIDLGLEALTMKRLAAHLNVGTATLYQYFDSRKALMRAAAVHSLSDVSLPEDVGQHWSQLAREYTLSIQGLLAENPSYINSYQETDYGFEVRFELTEKFLKSMSVRDFTAEAAMEIFNTVGMVAFAGAVEISRQREFEFQDETMDAVARKQLARLDAAAYPLTSKAVSIFTHTPEQKVDALLAAVFKTVARDRGEKESEIV